ncbi:MAG: thioredoxin [Propionibacteriaceae bacterium]|nr:thioredoxin [Propionibacteriaceae bacterium]
MSTLTAVTDATFAAEVLQSTQPVLVDFWADWCAPCRQLTPILEELSETYAGRIKFVAVDANTNLQTTMAHDIRNLPTIKIFKGGEVVQVFVGAVTKMALRKSLDELV